MDPDTIRETDPLKRPVFMYEPNHRTAKALAKNAPHLDIIGKGMYTNYASRGENRVWCRWTVEQEVEAIEKAGRPGAIPIAVSEMFQTPEEELLDRIPAWVRHDVYLALASGAKGVLVFSASKRPDFDRAREIYLETYLEVCRELTGADGLGRVFLFGEPLDDLNRTVLDGPETLELKLRRETRTYPSVAMANIRYRESRYVFLVNSAEEPVEVVVDGLVYGSAVTVENLFRPGERFTAPEGDFMTVLDPLEVEAYRIFLDR